MHILLVVGGPRVFSIVFISVGDADTVHLGLPPSAEKHVRVGVGHGGLREPEHSRKMSVSRRQLATSFEDTMATYYPLDILGRRLVNHPAPMDLPAALEEIRCGFMIVGMETRSGVLCSAVPSSSPRA